MAIVLVIIGLITGAVLVGRDMIKAAELRSIYNTVQRFQTAINVFKDKYGGLPGDLPNATNFLTCTKVATDFGGFNSSCNGNGNGLINAWGSGGGNTWEYTTALEHLYRTNLVAENRDGDTGDHILNPSVRLRIGARTEVLNNLNAKNCITLLGDVPATGGIGVGALSARDAYRLEMKYDDGTSNTGRIRAVRDTGSGNKCVGASRNYITAIDWTTENTSCLVDFLF
jgi:hypothetical protein